MDIRMDIQNIIDDNKNQNIIKFECSDELSDIILATLAKTKKSIGFVIRDHALYDQMCVNEYLKFFARLHHHKDKMDDAITAMHLHDLKKAKIKSLDAMQQLRVAIARVIIQDPQLFFIQEPLKDVDDETCQILLSWLDEVTAKNKRAIITSMSLKQLYLIDGCTYYINRKEVQLLEHEEPQMMEQAPLKMEKISVRSGDKTLLFNPTDIDYMESVEGKVYVNIRTDAFVCNATLDELEQKLKRYGFYRSHRSYLVNMQKVSEVIKWTRNSYSLKLESMEHVNIPLSKGRLEDMKEQYEI